MSEERIKQIKDTGSEKPEGSGSGKGQQKLTPEQLAGVVGGTAEQVAKKGGLEQENKNTHT